MIQVHVGCRLPKKINKNEIYDNNTTRDTYIDHVICMIDVCIDHTSHHLYMYSGTPVIRTPRVPLCVLIIGVSLCTPSSISPAVSLCGWTEKSVCARSESATKSANNHFHIANARPHDDNHLPSFRGLCTLELLDIMNYRS